MRGKNVIGDGDKADTNAVGVVENGAVYVGGLVLDAIVIDTGNGGRVRWTSSVHASALPNLAAGQQLIQSYDVTIDDGNGGTDSRTVTVTITGTNDAPVITDRKSVG